MNKELKEQLKRIERENNVKVVYLTKYGSKLYGTDNEKSDTDYKGVFISSNKDLLLERTQKSISFNSNPGNTKNSQDDIDLTLHSIHSFFDMLCNSEAGAVDLLYSMFREDTIVFENKTVTTRMKEERGVFRNTRMKSFIGYALGQTKKYGMKGSKFHELDSLVKVLPIGPIPKKGLTLGDMRGILSPLISDFKYINYVMAPGPKTSDRKDIEYLKVLGKLYSNSIQYEHFVELMNTFVNSFGNRTKSTANSKNSICSKSLSHALRISYEVLELLQTNFIQFPLKERDKIKYIKETDITEYELESVLFDIQDNLREVDEILEEGNIPKKVDRDKVDNFLLSLLYLNH